MGGAEYNFDFEWFLAGKISNLDFIEWKENLKMKNLNIKFLGMIDPELLIQNLIKSDIYIHTAYIDNSPNSISEAQILGLPIIATYVGGIPSLIENEVDGILIPANAPFSLSSEIMKLSKDKIKQRFLSQNAVLRARDRHDPVRISESIHFVYDQLNKSNI